MSYLDLDNERGTTALKGYNENTDPTKSLQGIFATPSPSIAERARCFGSIRTGVSNSSTKRMACSAKPNSPANPIVIALAESEPLCPANIVATRRILFSPTTNSKPRPIKDTASCPKSIALTTYDKENAGDEKDKRRSDVQSVRLREANISHSFSTVPNLKANDSIVEHTQSQVAEKNHEFEPKGLVEKRTLWLQGRSLPPNGITVPGRERTSVGTKLEQLTVDNGTVAARTTLLQKNLASNGLATKAISSLNSTGLANLHVEQAVQQQSPLAPRRGPSRLDSRRQDSNKSPSAPKNLAEVKDHQVATNTARKPKSLVETRAKWLEKQVSKNEMCHDVPSEEEDEVEKPKTDIQLRLEALQREMMAAQQHVSDGVAPKRCLAELP